MPIQKDYETPSTGAVASYHVVQQVSLDYVSTLTNATVASYLTKDARDAGRFPMHSQQIQIEGLPEGAADPRAFCEGRLVEAMPTDAATLLYANRYVLAGGEIITGS